jgi:Flp pilus assembly protein protease CpaA
MFQPVSLWAWSAWLLGLLTLAVATISDVKTLEVHDVTWIPALLYGTSFTIWSTVIMNSVPAFSLILAIVWIILGVIIILTGWMGGADGFAIISVALLAPAAAGFTLTLAFCILIATHLTLSYMINFARTRRQPAYTVHLKKNPLTAAILLAVTVKHPAPFHPEAGGVVYSERTKRFTWFTNTREDTSPKEGDWVQLPMPAIPFVLASYVLLLLLPAPF